MEWDVAGFKCCCDFVKVGFLLDFGGGPKGEVVVGCGVKNNNSWLVVPVVCEHVRNGVVGDGESFFFEPHSLGDGC